MTKILHVLHHSLPGPLDGYAIRAHAILRAQRSAGFEVDALTGSHDPAYSEEQTSIDGIRYFRTPSTIRTTKFGLRQYDHYAALLRRLRAVAENERPDILHVHSPAYNGAATLRVARQLNIPAVYEVRATWEDAAVNRRILRTSSPIYWAARALETQVLRRADAIVTICDGLKNEVLRRGVPADRVFVAPNGVRADDFRPLPRDEKLAETLGLTDEVVLGFIGSLFTYEGVEDLLDAVPQVLERCPQVRFLIVGGGERQQQVTQRVSAFAGTGRVVYVPRIPHAQVSAHYSLIDCLVYPRRSVRLTELVTPLKPIEAMAMAKAVVASNIGGHRELIAPERTGLLYEPGSVTSLCDVLCRVATDSMLRHRLATAARSHVLEHRTWETIISGHSAAYQRVMSATTRTVSLPIHQTVRSVRAD